MISAPLPPDSRSGGAAELERELERPVSGFSAANSQAQVFDLDDIRFQRAIARLHRLGERPLYEMLVEFGARYLLRSEIEAIVDRFAALDPVSVEAAGGDTFPPRPLHLIGGAR